MLKCSQCPEVQGCGHVNLCKFHRIVEGITCLCDAPKKVVKKKEDADKVIKKQEDAEIEYLKAENKRLTESMSKREIELYKAAYEEVEKRDEQIRIQCEKLKNRERQASMLEEIVSEQKAIIDEQSSKILLDMQKKIKEAEAAETNDLADHCQLKKLEVLESKLSDSMTDTELIALQSDVTDAGIVIDIGAKVKKEKKKSAAKARRKEKSDYFAKLSQPKTR